MPSEEEKLKTSLDKMTNRLGVAEKKAKEQKDKDADEIKRLKAQVSEVNKAYEETEVLYKRSVELSNEINDRNLEISSKLETLSQGEISSERLLNLEAAAHGFEDVAIERGEEVETAKLRIIELEGKVKELGGHVEVEEDYEAKVERLASCKKKRSECHSAAQKSEKALHKFDQDAMKDTGEIPPSVGQGDRRRSLVRKVNAAGGDLDHATKEYETAQYAVANA